MVEFINKTIERHDIIKSDSYIYFCALRQFYKYKKKKIILKINVH